MVGTGRVAAFDRPGLLRFAGRTHEVVWFKSSSSGDSECVEVASLDALRFVRDSTDVDGPVVPFTAGDWTALLDAVRGL
ncbi:DUF397 domain-containing protein [Actinomadura gamaensis]|uniref:DUF397 domain-containing protein n=1 Tax=Actinomadura gamaensis TaxID=1763541 RepID=A0ABV9U9Z5_9ACTN